MKTFKVRVVKASLNTYWYADKIGKVFDVMDYGNGKYQGGNIPFGAYIIKSDCVIVEGMKIGDRVWMKDECECRQGRYYRRYGGYGIIGSLNEDQAYRVDLDTGSYCWCKENDLILLEEKMKIGDRVRVKDECVGKQARAGDGGCGTITHTHTLYDYRVHLDGRTDGASWGYDAHELILLEDEMEYTVNGVTYRQ